MSLHSDKTPILLQKTYSDFWKMKKRIGEVVALRNTAVLERFVQSEEARTFSCIHIIGELYKLLYLYSHMNPDVDQLVQATSSICTTLMQRNNTLIERDMEKYGSCPDIAHEIIESIQSLLCMPFFFEVDRTIPIQYKTRFYQGRMELTEMITTTNLFTHALELCKKHRHNKHIVVELLDLISNMMQQGNPLRVKDYFSRPTRITDIQDIAYSILQTNISQQTKIEIESKCSKFIQYLFHDGCHCSEVEEIQVCQRITEFVKLGCVCENIETNYLETLLYKTKNSTLKTLYEKELVQILWQYVKPKYFDIHELIIDRCTAIIEKTSS
jgi:hypothetical protein